MFYAANPRPAIAPILAAIGGRFRAVGANAMNFLIVEVLIAMSGTRRA